MTTPHVIELPRRLEPGGRDTFLGGVVIAFPQPAGRDDAVVALRAPDAVAITRRTSSAPPPPPVAA